MRLVVGVLAMLFAVPSMAQVSYPPADLTLYAKAADVSTAAATYPQFVNAGAFQTTAQLLANFPCAAGTLGKLGRVSDAFGSVSTTFICENDAVLGYYWRPQRTDYASVSTQTSGTLTLQPLITAPVIYLSSTPTSGVTIALSTTNVWPGASFHIYAPSTITLNGITITGLVGGGTVPLLQGSDKILTYTASGWKSN